MFVSFRIIPYPLMWKFSCIHPSKRLSFRRFQTYLLCCLVTVPCLWDLIGHLASFLLFNSVIILNSENFIFSNGSTIIPFSHLVFSTLGLIFSVPSPCGVCLFLNGCIKLAPLLLYKCGYNTRSERFCLLFST